MSSFHYSLVHRFFWIVIRSKRWLCLSLCQYGIYFLGTTSLMRSARPPLAVTRPDLIQEESLYDYCVGVSYSWWAHVLCVLISLLTIAVWTQIQQLKWKVSMTSPGLHPHCRVCSPARPIQLYRYHNSPNTYLNSN